MHKDSTKPKYFFSWKWVIAVLPNLTIAIAYLVVLHQNVLIFSLTAKELSIMMQLECLALNTFPFIIYVLYVKEETLYKNIKKWLQFLFLIVLFTYSSFLIGGWYGLFGYGAVSISTYSGFLFSLRDTEKYFELGFRWVTGLICLVAWASLLDISTDVYTWSETRDTLYLGLAYFASLALLDAFGFYQSRYKEKIKAFWFSSSKK